MGEGGGIIRYNNDYTITIFFKKNPLCFNWLNSAMGKYFEILKI